MREDIAMKTCLLGPVDYAKKLKLRCRVGDMDLTKRTKRYTSSREEEDVATNMFPCGTTLEQDSQRRKCNIQGETGCVRGRDEEIRRM